MFTADTYYIVDTSATSTNNTGNCQVVTFKTSVNNTALYCVISNCTACDG